MSFEFMTASRIVFGAGALAQVGQIALSLTTAKRAFVITGGNAGRAEPLLALLAESGITATTYAVRGEPTVDVALAGVSALREAGADVVIGFGGGSVIDGAKAVAALATNPGDPLDYLEVVGKAQPLTAPPLPTIAIPTTAGTGSEVTRNAVLGVEEKRVKVSLRSPMMIPRVALIDPQLATSLPPEVTASAGMDALTQVIEAFVSIKATPMTDAVTREGIMRGARSLQRAYTQPDDIAAREDMALTALFSGMALANAALGAVHGFAGPLGGMYPIAHGVICARLLPIVMEANIRALRARQPDGVALTRYGEVARLLTGRADAVADDGVAWAYQLRETLHIPPLGGFGVEARDFDDIVEKSSRANSMKGNPLPLTDEELRDIIDKAV
jgi:alcohol dehydrogenase class IV